MRTLCIVLAVLAALFTPRAHAQQGGHIGSSVRIVAPEQLHVGGDVRVTAGRVSAPLTLTFRSRPSVQVERTTGGPACFVDVLGGGAPGAWNARLRCAPLRGAAVQVVRLIVTPPA